MMASFALPLWESGFFQAAKDNPELVHEPAFLAVYFAFYLVAYFVVIFFNAALISCAMIRLRGGDPTVGDGLRAASRHLPAIFGWSLLSAVVGMLVQAIEQRVGFLGKLVVSLIGLAWAIASYFVIPVIVTENVGPVEALKRSAEIIKKMWGETLTTQIGLSVVTGIAAMISGLILAAGTIVVNDAPVVGISLVALGVAAMLAGIVIGAALQAILTAALYLYAADGKAPQNFDGKLLDAAFARK
jgi:hypothetical protein